MSTCLRLCARLALIGLLAVTAFGAPNASAAKVKIAWPGPATTYWLPYLVAQKQGWLTGLDMEEVVVTGDANAMRVLLSGNADILTVGTLNTLASLPESQRLSDCR